MNKPDTPSSLEQHLQPEPRMPDAEHKAFVEAKTRTGIKQAMDRGLLVPASSVWDKFGFER